MPTIKITPIGKHGQLLAYEPTFKLNSHFVPRVGEILELDRKIDGTYYLVATQINYEVENQTLTPHVTAQVWFDQGAHEEIS